MASSNKTENYSLNQWVGTDPVLMADFNADNVKIDEALLGLKNSALKFACGSYTGSGGYGSAAPNSLSFDFKPCFVLVRKYYKIPLNPTSLGAAMIRPMSCVPMEMYAAGDTENTKPLNLSWGEKSVSWWYSGTSGLGSYGANWQLNSDGDIYYYFAIGV